MRSALYKEKASLTMPPKIKRIQTQILILLTNSCFRYRCHIHVCCTDQSKMVQTHTGALVFAFGTQVGGGSGRGGNVLAVTGASCLKFAFSIISFHDIWGQKFTDQTLLFSVFSSSFIPSSNTAMSHTVLQGQIHLTSNSKLEWQCQNFQWNQQ